MRLVVAVILIVVFIVLGVLQIKKPGPVKHLLLFLLVVMISATVLIEFT